MANATTPAIVGIDLGTTNSACAIVRDGAPVIIENALGDSLTPSVVASDQRSGSLIVGRTAKDILAASPHLGASQFKRVMGDDETFTLGDRQLSAIELSAYVLDALREDAERALSTTIDRAVVTVPAYFNDSQRFATKRAAEMAGLAVERILNEPTAAAIAYGLDTRDDESQFLVVDLGGGTFDVCVMELFEGLLAVKSVAGESRLGGEDFTAALVDHVCKRAELDAGRMRRENAERYALLYKRCEVLKRTLSRWQAASIEIPSAAGSPIDMEVTAAEANQAFGPLVDRLMGPIRNALRGASIAPDVLDEVVLVGGATRMPVVRTFIEELLGRKPLAELDPDLVVAQGAAIQAALCADDMSVGDIVITDIASHSMGVDTTRKIGGRYIDGNFSPIIHRNTVIPTSRSETYHPIEPGQTSVTFAVFEGESRRVEDNRKIGEFSVNKLPPKDGEVKVTFTYDLDGILEVEAEVVKTGRKQTHIFTRDGRDLDDASLERARSRIRRIRGGPRDRPRHRDLLARAHLLWKEASEDVRHHLGHCIDDFEAALEERAGPAIDRAYKVLEEACQELDKGERW